MKELFTSEYVTSGHPDKVADCISDSILDSYLDGDPMSRVAVETLVCQDNVIVAGEVTSKVTIDTDKIIKDTVNKIGYFYNDMKFNFSELKITNLIHTQSPDISMGVDVNGAGDQGIMFGGAHKGIDQVTMMPDCWKIAKELIEKFETIQCANTALLRPDGKSQVTIAYEDGKKPIIDSVVLSCQHDPSVQTEELRKVLTLNVINPVIDKYLNKGLIDFNPSIKTYINPTGRFVIGGPDGDTGVTGRKIVVDGYGGYYPVGGGAFSGKDPTKVDRSGAYLARYIAKNIVGYGYGNDCQVQLSYAIGVPEPISIHIVVDGKIRTDLADLFKENVKMDPKSIIERFDLRREKKLFSYADLASNGHFGREDIELPWEKLDCEWLKK